MNLKTRYIVGIIIVCISMSLYLRIVLPYDNIFTNEWIKFSGVDAYWQMAQVDKYAPNFPSHFAEVFSIPFFVWLLSGVTWCIGLGSPTQATIDTVGVYYPAVLAALTIIPVYIIGRKLFSVMAGLIAAAIIAILPGEWLGRSILGFTDHHVMEVLLSTAVIAFFIMAVKSEKKRRIAFTVLTALFVGLYLRTSLIGIIFLFIIGAYLCVQAGIDTYHRRKGNYLLVLLGLGVVSLILFYFIYPKPFHDVIRMSQALDVTGSQAITTSEMRPLFFPMGNFTTAVVWASFGLISIVAPMAIVILIWQAVRGNPDVILLVMWSIVTLILMVMYRRFAYYFAVNASLLTGWFIWYVWYRLRANSTLFATITCVLLLGVVLVPNTQHSMGVAKHPPYTPTDAWCETMDWVRENTPEDSLILSWWDYGYWINRMAQREAYVTPSQPKIPITNTARMFLSANGEETIDADYIILDYDTTNDKLWAIITWAGKQPSEFGNVYYLVKDGVLTPVRLYYPEYYQSLAVRLYNFNGLAITTSQSTVITFNPSNGELSRVDVYATAEEALRHVKLGSRLVGTTPFISPISLQEKSRYTLAYESSQKKMGVPEVKVFKRVAP